VIVPPWIGSVKLVFPKFLQLFPSHACKLILAILGWWGIVTPGSGQTRLTGAFQAVLLVLIAMVIRFQFMAAVAYFTHGDTQQNIYLLSQVI
jgi:hypothetical protein